MCAGEREGGEIFSYLTLTNQLGKPSSARLHADRSAVTEPPAPRHSTTGLKITNSA